MYVGKLFKNNPRIIESYEYAKLHHKGQFRKGTSKPYINHCVEVASILFENGYSEDIVISGMLHDVVEDTKVTILDVEKKFGKKIANIIRNVSENKSSELSWSERKVKYLRRLTNTSEESIVVSAADKLHNITETFQEWLEIGDMVFEKFNAGKDSQKWFYRSLTDVYIIRGVFFKNDSIMKIARSINGILAKMGM